MSLLEWLKCTYTYKFWHITPALLFGRLGECGQALRFASHVFSAICAPTETLLLQKKRKTLGDEEISIPGQNFTK